MDARISSAGILTALLAAALLLPAALADPASQIVVVLPGQELVSGSASGSPLPVVQREPFTVRVYAVDAFGNWDFDYVGPIVGVDTDESSPTPGLRMGTMISGIGAATSIPPGSQLRIAINGEGFRDYTLAAAATGDEVCQAIEDALASPPEGALSREIEFGCVHVAGPSRYLLYLGDERPARSNLDGHYLENTLEIDPTFGAAPALGFDTSVPPPAGPSTFLARRLVSDPQIDQVFHSGFAAFRMTWADLADSGTGKTLSVDQGGGPPLPVSASPYEVVPAAFEIKSATALGDGNGNITRIHLTFNTLVDETSLDGHAGDFALEWVGVSTPIPGSGISLVGGPAFAHPASTIEVTFGSGIGKTDIQDVRVIYTPPSSGSISSSEGVGALVSTDPPLKDGAPPVIVNLMAQDTDSNNGLDRLVFTFSEPVAFSGGRGVSISGFEPATSTADSLSLPASLRLVVDGDETTVAIVDPDNPAATSIDGGDAIAEALTYAVRASLSRPAILNFTCEFVNGRYVLRSGSVGAGSSVAVLPAPANDAAPSLRLGQANGGVERPGYGDGVADPDDWVVLSSDHQDNLREGLTSASFVITGPELEVGLTNVPGSGTATPTYMWKDSGDLGFLTDRAVVPNRASPSNNASLPNHPQASDFIRIRDTDSNPSDGIISSPPGTVELDSTPSVLPLLATHDSGTRTFSWTQVSGPVAATVVSPDEPITDTDLLLAGSYTFELTVTVLGTGGTPVFSADWTAEGTLTDTVPVVVTPGPPVRAVILLPGQTLQQGVATLGEAIDGGPYLATPGVPFEVRVVCTDQFFNVLGCAAATASLETSEPGTIIVPASQPLAGSEVSFTVHPATAGDWLIDDVLVGFSESDDAPAGYATGSAWNAVAEKLPGLPPVIRLSWITDWGIADWHIYSGGLWFTDSDRDGLPDGGYGTCVSMGDPDPHDGVFEDATEPAPGSGFFYVGTMALGGEETVPGTTSAGLVRVVAGVCP